MLFLIIISADVLCKGHMSVLEKPLNFNNGPCMDVIDDPMYDYIYDVLNVNIRTKLNKLGSHMHLMT